MLHPRVAREPLSQVCHSQEPPWLIILLIVLPHLVVQTTVAESSELQGTAEAVQDGSIVSKNSRNCGVGQFQGSYGICWYSEGTMLHCDQPGHFSRFCPYPPRKKQQTYPARVHSTTVDEIPEGEPVTAGKFPVN
jgi:hypothetical protein